MTKLNQIIAIENGTKAKTEQVLTTAHHSLQRKEPLSGIARTYTPMIDGGEELPSESTRVQVRVSDTIEQVQVALAELFDVTATKEYANTEAKADVVVNGTTLLTGVPVSYLLFLEKQLVNIKTFVTKLPTLDPGETWHWDSGQNCYATAEYVTMRAKKTPQRFVKAEATDKHPAQVEIYYEDVPVGRWRTIKYSGAILSDDVSKMLSRIEALQAAVKMAREDANSIVVTKQEVGKKVMTYLFGA